MEVIICSVLLLIVLLVFAFVLLVWTGNLSAMKLLAKNGVAVFCNNIVKDCKLLNYVNKEGACWLSIPDVCYSPVMYSCDGKYKNHNFLQKNNLNGELYIDSGMAVAKTLQLLRLPSNYKVPDLTIIQGNFMGNGSNLRQANFSQLRKITERLKTQEKLDTNSIKICEDGVVRQFIPMCLVDLQLSDPHKFECSSRESFINSVLEFSKIKTQVDVTSKNVVILECKTNIDLVMVLLAEIGGDSNEKK